MWPELSLRSTTLHLLKSYLLREFQELASYIKHFLLRLSEYLDYRVYSGFITQKRTILAFTTILILM